MAPRKWKYIGQVNPNCKGMRLLRAGPHKWSNWRQNSSEKQMWSWVHSILITPVSVASRRATGWTAGVGFPAGGRCFSSPQLPDRFWGPHSLLSIEYQGLFLWV
jgi:hypothetical protein